MYYFGCWDEPGHYLHDPRGRVLRREQVGPFDVYGQMGLPLDERFTPGPHPHGGSGLQDESFVALTYVRGWTVMAMWDRSVDTRPGCNAAFIREGRLSEADMWALARQHYPRIVARLKAAQGRTIESPETYRQAERFMARGIEPRDYADAIATAERMRDDWDSASMQSIHAFMGMVARLLSHAQDKLVGQWESMT